MLLDVAEERAGRRRSPSQVLMRTPGLALLVLALASSACRRATASTAPALGECPDEMALVSLPRGRVCVDRYEAAIDGWSFARTPLAQAPPLPAKPAKGIEPQVNVSEPQAEAACAASGKRLCTEAEWTAACRGPSGHVYPYGDEHVAGACNDDRPSPVPAVQPEGGRLDDPRLAEAPDGIAPGGSFPQCVTPTGIFDMDGNVHEWVSTSPRADDDRYGMFLGGFFADAKENGEGCGYRTTAHFKSYHDYSTGFRCCKDPGDVTTGAAAR